MLHSYRYTGSSDLQLERMNVYFNEVSQQTVARYNLFATARSSKLHHPVTR
jgi:hypothetical protein